MQLFAAAAVAAWALETETTEKVAAVNLITVTKDWRAQSCPSAFGHRPFNGGSGGGGCDGDGGVLLLSAEFTYYVDDLLFALCFEVGHGDVADVGGHSIELAFVG